MSDFRAYAELGSEMHCLKNPENIVKAMKS